MDEGAGIRVHLELGVAVPDSVDLQLLYRLADGARANAYVPYSSLPIGAAIQWRGGDVSVGANVENGSYGLTICAERVAAVRGASEGMRQIEAVVVAGDPKLVETFSPCGACRQFLREFDVAEAALVGFRDEAVIRVWNLSDLLPVSFRLRAPEV